MRNISWAVLGDPIDMIECWVVVFFSVLFYLIEKLFF